MSAKVDIVEHNQAYRDWIEMKAKCTECGHNLKVSTDLIKTVIGGGLIASAGYGWVSYAFAGLLGFSGGAMLIAIALLTGGGAVLASKDSSAIIAVGRKITDLLNDRSYACPKCKKSNWAFAGYKDTEIVTDAEHRLELRAAFKNAKQELCIASGFLSSYVVDSGFIRDLETALRRNVKVKLIFSDARSHSDWMAAGYREALNSLEFLADNYSSLELIQKHTHQKGIVVDDQYAISGSFNFLSNKRVDRQESSTKIYDTSAIDQFRRGLLTA
jgi:hypothetical protein